MSNITLSNKGKIDNIVISIPNGSTMFFWQISDAIWGNRRAACQVGRYIATQRSRPGYPYWRVINDGGSGIRHPVAELNAITQLEIEGHVIVNGAIV